MVFLIMSFILNSCSPCFESEDNLYPKKPEFETLDSATKIGDVFGKLEYTPWFGTGGIYITNQWDIENLDTIYVSQLVGTPTWYHDFPHDGNVIIHNKIARQFKMLWHAWEKAGVLTQVVSWGGSYASRKVRGSWFYLSSHTYGIAFDINYQENPFGETPAQKGEHGCVYDLVPIALEHGFYWGGHFCQPDGMHFEVAKVLDKDEITALKQKYAYPG